MTEPNFHECLQDALTKAFASQDVRARESYLLLAEFYERQAVRANGVASRILR